MCIRDSDYAALVLSQIDWQGACANAVVNAGEADTAEGAAFPVLVDPCCACLLYTSRCV